MYREIEELCKKNGAKMLIVLIGKGRTLGTTVIYNSRTREDFDLEDAIIVDAYSALFGRLQNKNGKTYMSIYMQYRGVPPVLVDAHPNAYAHSIIASEIVKSIETLK